MDRKLGSKWLSDARGISSSSSSFLPFFKSIGFMSHKPLSRQVWESGATLLYICLSICIYLGSFFSPLCCYFYPISPAQPSSRSGCTFIARPRCTITLSSLKESPRGPGRLPVCLSFTLCLFSAVRQVANFLKLWGRGQGVQVSQGLE